LIANEVDLLMASVVDALFRDSAGRLSEKPIPPEIIMLSAQITRHRKASLRFTGMVSTISVT